MAIDIVFDKCLRGFCQECIGAIHLIFNNRTAIYCECPCHNRDWVKQKEVERERKAGLRTEE